MAIDIWNEGSDVLVTATFTDEDGNAVTPDTARYRVDDLKSGTSIAAAASITGLSTSNVLTIPASQNAILDDGNMFETRIVTVDFVYGLPAKHGTGEYRYQLRNLGFAPVG